MAPVRYGIVRHGPSVDDRWRLGGALSGVAARAHRCTRAEPYGDERNGYTTAKQSYTRDRRWLAGRGLGVIASEAGRLRFR